MDFFLFAEDVCLSDSFWETGQEVDWRELLQSECWKENFNESNKIPHVNKTFRVFTLKWSNISAW